MGIEVIGASYGRTGTHSFRSAMEILGFGKCYHMEEVFKNCHAAEWVEISKGRDPELIREIMDKNGYRSSCDMPSSIYWQEQLQAYPDAKVVITTRDPERWHQSWTSTITRVQPDAEECPFGTRVMYGLGFRAFRMMGQMMHDVITQDSFHDDCSKQNMIKSYKDHIENVKKNCPAKQLLLFNAADGWEPLCTFLGVPIPDEPYPFLNDSKEFQAMASGLNIMGWILTIVGLGIPALFRYRSKITELKKMYSNIA